jgi:hypothetical protein
VLALSNEHKRSARSLGVSRDDLPNNQKIPSAECGKIEAARAPRSGRHFADVVRMKAQSGES